MILDYFIIQFLQSEAEELRNPVLTSKSKII